jgi:hypothetical protein
MLLQVVRTFLSLFLLLNTLAAFGFSPDLRLLQLVPPESQIVAGMIGPIRANQLSSFLLVTRNNEFDQEDFVALTGGDATRSIREVVFVAAAGRGEFFGEHSLLAAGHFNREAIFRFAEIGSARRESYRGVPVLVVPALARERGHFTELRWLAIPDERTAVFGSVTSVQRELDRWIANSPADEEFVERLSRLNQNFETWCLLPAPKADGMVARVLKGLDPRLGDVAGQGGTIQYGIHFGKSIEVAASVNPVSEVASGPVDMQLAQPMVGVSYFFSNSDNVGANAPKRVVVKVAQRRYERWLEEFSSVGLTTARF